MRSINSNGTIQEWSTTVTDCWELHEQLKQKGVLPAQGIKNKLYANSPMLS